MKGHTICSMETLLIVKIDALFINKIEELGGYCFHWYKEILFRDNSNKDEEKMPGLYNKTNVFSNIKLQLIYLYLY